MTEMFCFQCEQTAGGTGCTKVGVCGKKPEVAHKQDELTCALIGLARAAEGKKTVKQTDELVMQGLFATLTNVNFDPVRIDELKKQVEVEKSKLGNAQDFNSDNLFHGDTDIVSLRSTLLFGLRGMAAYAWHAYLLGNINNEVTSWLYTVKNTVLMSGCHLSWNWDRLISNAWLYWIKRIHRLSGILYQLK